MKKLNNLVPDIYKILDSLTEGKELKISEEMYEEFGKDMADALRHWSTPQDRTQKEILRMSNIGKPERRLWFDAHTQSDTTEKLEPNIQIKFLYGHLLEVLLLFFVKLSGHKLTDMQKEIIVKNEPPELCYDPVPEGASGNMKLDRGCTWCPHKIECHKDANDGQGLRVFNYAKGPVYFTKIVKEPKVEEVKL